MKLNNQINELKKNNKILLNQSNNIYPITPAIYFI